MMRNNRLRDTDDRILTAIGMAIVLCVIVAMVSVPTSAVIVNFPDPELEAAIRSAIGKPTEDIHDTDLIELTFLDADNKGIVNLEGIQYCVDLMCLLLRVNQIVDIGDLVDNAGMDAGDWVDLHYNFLDLTPGSDDMLDIEALQGREVRVYFDPQD